MIWVTPKTSKPRDSFMVKSGERMGELLILMESTPGSFYFLSYPLNVIRVYEKGKFDFERKSNIIEFIQRLPKAVYKGMKISYDRLKQTGNPSKWDKETLRTQIRKNEDFNNRREQPGVEVPVGRKKFL